MTTPTQLRAVVIGGGILGVSTAAALQRLGAAVTVVTRGKLADGASGRSLSWLNSSGPTDIRSAEYHRLRLLGIDRYRTFATRHDATSWLRFDGGLTWAAPDGSFRNTYTDERRRGYDAEWLLPEDIASHTPGIDPAAVAAEGVLFNPGEGWVDLPSIVGVLAEELMRNGGTILSEAGDTVPVVESGAVVGVRTGDGTVIRADRVLLATGPEVPAQLAELGVAVPNGSPAALVAWTKPVETGLRAVLNTPRVSLRPTPDGGLVMDSGWSEEVLRVEDGRITAPEGVIEELFEEASRILAAHPRLELAGVGTGMKPIPGDGEPVLGRIDQIDGLFAAFSHSGATIGLIAGELLAHEITTGETPEVLQAFRPGRFLSAATR